MAKIPKNVSERLIRTVSKFQKVLKIAKDRDVNESDTVSIISDMLAEVFGFDKYLELTSEFSIRGTYCDLAIKFDNKTQFLIEVKAIGIDLKTSHLRQAIDYGANQGIQWIILTNGCVWEIYKIRFEKPINYDLVCSFDFMELNPKKEEDQEKLFLICKQGIKKDARESFYEKVQSFNRFVVGALILNEEILNDIRRELRKLSPGIKVDIPEIEQILRNEVLKRDVIEGDEAANSQAQVKRFYKKFYKKEARKQKTSKEKKKENSPSSIPTAEVSSSDSSSSDSEHNNLENSNTIDKDKNLTME